MISRHFGKDSCGSSHSRLLNKKLSEWFYSLLTPHFMKFHLVLASSTLAAPAISNTKLPFDIAAQFAGAAYCKKLYDQKNYICNRNLCTPNTTLLLSYKDQQSHGAALVTVNSNFQTIFISFRGTSGKKDAVGNLKAWATEADWLGQEPTFESDNLLPQANWEGNDPNFLQGDDLLPSNLYIHNGFKTIYTSLRNEVLGAVNKAIKAYPSHQLVFTGHSLGGALATMAAVDFNDLVPGYGDRISLYTFGQPRVGNKNWAQYVDSLPFGNRMYRVVRKGDPVAHLVYSKWGYQHSGQQYELLDDGSIQVCKNNNGSRESFDCLNDYLSIKISRHFEYYGLFSGC
jgi:hypothetical protein